MFDCLLRQQSSIKSLDFFLIYWCHKTDWDWKTTCAPTYAVSIIEIWDKKVRYLLNQCMKHSSYRSQAAFCWWLRTHVTNICPHVKHQSCGFLLNWLDFASENTQNKAKCVCPLWMLFFRLYNVSPLSSWVKEIHIHPKDFTVINSIDTIVSYSNINIEVTSRTVDTKLHMLSEVCSWKGLINH